MEQPSPIPPVACSSDAECPFELVCGAAGLCVELLGLDAPSVTAARLSQSRASAGVEVLLELEVSQALAVAPQIRFDAPEEREFLVSAQDGLRWTLSYTVRGDEPERSVVLITELVGEGGNRTVSPLNVGLTFDLTSPQILADSVVASIEPGENPWRFDLAALSPGATLRVSLSMSEAVVDVDALSESGRRPEAFLVPAAAELFDAEAAVLRLTPTGFGTRAGLNFSATLQNAAEDGEYRLWVSATDEAGNQAIVRADDRIAIDQSPPTSPDVDTDNTVVFVEAPWGVLGESAPSYALESVPSAVESGARILVFDQADATPDGALVSSEPHGALPLTTAIGSVAVAEVFVVAVDEAGNPSDADLATPGVQGRRVLDRRWIATFNGKQRADVGQNPHSFRINRELDGSLSGSSFAEEPDNASLAALADVDGLGPVARSELEWRDASVRRRVTPGGRCNATLTPSPAQDGLLLFGGNRVVNSCPLRDGVVCDDLWLWNGNVWAPVLSDGRPPARTGHSAVFDRVRSRLVIFGGSESGSGCNVSRIDSLADTWVFDGRSWSDISGADGPSARAGHAAAYDPQRDEIVLFGGVGFVSVGDTWVFDGVRWIERSPATSPSPRFGHAMVYDESRDETLLFGGQGEGIDCDLTRQCNGLWRWNGTDWELISSVGPGPSPRFSASFVFDPEQGRALLFGGDGASCPCDDTWAWDGTQWSVLEAGNGLASYAGSAVQWDSLRDEALAFGGGANRPECETDDFGRFECDQLRAFSGSWTDRSLELATLPPTRTRHSMAVDETTGEIVIFGGRDTSGCVDGDEACDDSWTFDGELWKQVPGGAPGARVDAPVVFDSTLERLVSFGGFSDLDGAECLADGLGCRDSWQYTKTTGWENITASPVTAANTPAARYANHLAYDSTRDEVVLFGGINEFGGCPNGVFCDDTWTLNGSTWTRRSPSISPEQNFNGAMAHHRAAGLTYLFGGTVSGSSDPTDRMWAWNGTDWQEVAQSSPWPPARSEPHVFYDESSAALILDGGRRLPTGDGCPEGSVGEFECDFVDLWTFDGTAWSRESATREAGPDAGFAYSSVERRLYGFGRIGFERDRLIELRINELPAHYLAFDLVGTGIVPSQITKAAISVPADAVVFRADGTELSVAVDCDRWAGVDGWQSLSGARLNDGEYELTVGAPELVAADGTLPLRCAARSSEVGGLRSETTIDAVQLSLDYR